MKLERLSFENIRKLALQTQNIIDDEMLQPKIDEQLEKVVSELENDFTDRIKTKVEKRMKTLINKIDINVLVGEK